MARGFSGSVLAATIARLPLIPLDIHVFEPFKTQWSPLSTARDFIAARSLPAPGSDIAIISNMSPEMTPGKNRCFCSSEPKSAM